MEQENIIAAKIKAYLLDNGIKQTYVSKKSGKSIKKINDIVNGRVRVTIDALYDISDSLNLPRDFFLK